MAAFKLAVKNLYRNLKYTLGLFFVFLAAAVMTVSFFIFSDMSQAAFTNILSRQASTSFVSVSFSTITFFNADGSTYTDKGDISTGDLSALTAIDGVEDVYHFCTDTSSCGVSLGGGGKMEMEISALLFEGGDMPRQFIQEYESLYEDGILVCGDWTAGKENGCLVSESFAGLTGAESAEDLLGKTLSTYVTLYSIYGEGDNTTVGISEGEYLEELVITGVVSKNFSGISFMENYSGNFIFADISSLAYEMSFPNCYLLYGSYSDLGGIEEAAEGLGITGANVTNGNTSYAMKKLSQTSRFVSAILVIIAVICLFAAVGVITGVSMLKFERSRTFYYAAYAAGLSKNNLALSFLYEFCIVAFAAFLAALPLGALLVNLLADMLSLYAGAAFAAQLSFAVSLCSLLPLAAAGATAAGIVRLKINFGS